MHACSCIYPFLPASAIGQTDLPQGQVASLRGRSLPLTTRATDVPPHIPRFWT